ncbi:winged helix-turn-helix transcriptional regulator [Hymenobacter arizonensis]|uniref:DNA-binding transcriptional regulator, HxlR family n=1 Tax=Hymenobacter arizonensis TaxID=1227077 RepID=A0A1I5Z7B9_HYMAR|nr:helix-turn-helix domain-containing protein [Hymenobacter arizonensis]SFQ52350.1 DNA-binding transcriptional regulator, HxlR family [Hymenobacter arizonensis]
MKSTAITLTPGCPVRTTMEMLGGKWRLLILHQLAAGPLRFGALRRLVPDISEKVLVHELRHLADSGLVLRTNHGEVPPRVEYHLTDLGRLALPVLAAVGEFGQAYVAQARLPRGSEESSQALDQQASLR